MGGKQLGFGDYEQTTAKKAKLRGKLKNGCKVNVLAALTNLFLARRQLLATP